MRSRLLLFVVLLSSVALAEDWKVRDINQPPDLVFKAADRAVAKHYQVELSDPDRKIIRFKVNTTAWSYGYTMTLSVDPRPEGSRITAFIQKKGGSVVSWGKGKSELLRIYDSIDDELLNMRQAAK